MTSKKGKPAGSRDLRQFLEGLVVEADRVLAELELAVAEAKALEETLDREIASEEAKSGQSDPLTPKYPALALALRERRSNAEATQRRWEAEYRRTAMRRRVLLAGFPEIEGGDERLRDDRSSEANAARR